MNKDHRNKLLALVYNHSKAWSLSDNATEDNKYEPADNFCKAHLALVGFIDSLTTEET